jgi:hypothetical protein
MSKKNIKINNMKPLGLIYTLVQTDWARNGLLDILMDAKRNI